MLNINNNTANVKREILVRIARLQLEGRLEEGAHFIPRKMVRRNAKPLRCCVFHDREIIRMRTIARMGISVENVDEERTLASFAREALERPRPTWPMLTVLHEACNACVKAHYMVTNACQGCDARPCMVNCPKNAVRVERHAHIDSALCINCGKCMENCPYHAIIKIPVPCEEACPVGAISKDENGREKIDYHKCIFCGNCIRECPFGAMMSKSQLVDVIKHLMEKEKLQSQIEGGANSISQNENQIEENSAHCENWNSQSQNEKKSARCGEANSISQNGDEKSQIEDDEKSQIEENSARCDEANSISQIEDDEKSQSQNENQIEKKSARYDDANSISQNGDEKSQIEENSARCDEANSISQIEKNSARCGEANFAQRENGNSQVQAEEIFSAKNENQIEEKSAQCGEANSISQNGDREKSQSQVEGDANSISQIEGNSQSQVEENSARCDDANSISQNGDEKSQVEENSARRGDANFAHCENGNSQVQAEKNSSAKNENQIEKKSAQKSGGNSHARAAKKVVALYAPAIAAQFNAVPGQIEAALKAAGFDRVWEVAIGADICAQKEAREFEERMARGDKMMTTSCCPAYVRAVRRHVPALAPCISETKTPMHYTACIAKKADPGCVTVFIGPCLAKRREGFDDEMVDYVMSTADLEALLIAKEIDVSKMPSEKTEAIPSSSGRNFAKSGGVAEAVKVRLSDKSILREAKINGLSKKGMKTLNMYGMMNEGKIPLKPDSPNLIEVMACEGGCIGGPSIRVNVSEAEGLLAKYVAAGAKG